MIARMAEVGWEINKFNGQSTAQRESDFSDRNAEVWYTAAGRSAKGKVILPDDPLLHEQMVARKRGAEPRGGDPAESKDAMAARGLKAPTGPMPSWRSSRSGRCFSTTSSRTLAGSRLSKRSSSPPILERNNIMGADAGI